MSYGNWKYILAVFSFHNSVFNGIFVNNTIWRDPLPYLAATFDHLFFFFFLSSLGLMRAFLHPLFFLFPFTLGGFFFFLHCMQFLGFFFFFFSSSSFTIFSSAFFFSFFFHWVQVSRFFFFFFHFVCELGYWKKKKLHRVTGMGPTNSVKNIEWWQVSDGAKRVGYFKWWVINDRNWVMKNIDSTAP